MFETSDIINLFTIIEISDKFVYISDIKDFCKISEVDDNGN